MVSTPPREFGHQHHRMEEVDRGGDDRHKRQCDETVGNQIDEHCRPGGHEILHNLDCQDAFAEQIENSGEHKDKSGRAKHGRRCVGEDPVAVSSRQVFCDGVVVVWEELRTVVRTQDMSD